MWGPFLVMGAFWWIVPLIGFLVCLAFMLIARRFGWRGCGCMCTGGRAAGDGKTTWNAGHRGAGRDEF